MKSSHPENQQTPSKDRYYHTHAKHYLDGAEADEFFLQQSSPERKSFDCVFCLASVGAQAVSRPSVSGFGSESTAKHTIKKWRPRQKNTLFLSFH